MYIERKDKRKSGGRGVMFIKHSTDHLSEVYVLQLSHLCIPVVSLIPLMK